MRARSTDSGSSCKNQAMLSRAVITLLTRRVSSSNTLAITCCSRAASTPACAPASVMARMSAEVILSSRAIGMPSTLNKRSVARVKNHTSGLKAVISSSIGPTMRTASRSGALMPRRLGNRSANTRNTAITITNEHRKAMLAATSTLSQFSKKRAKYGLSEPSPTTPPRIATAFRPICTTVK
ncbi:hypothetical protein D3C72_1872530 [compost metagenome]